MGVGSEGWGQGGRGGGEFDFFLLFLFFFFLGVDLAGWISIFQTQSFSAEGERGEEASDGGDKFCFVELKFFGGVEAGRVGEGGGEVVGSFGERREEGEEGDWDDGVFYSGGGRFGDEGEGGGWGMGRGKGTRAGGTFFPLHADAHALGAGGSVGSLVVFLNNVCWK